MEEKVTVMRTVAQEIGTPANLRIEITSTKSRGEGRPAISDMDPVIALSNGIHGGAAIRLEEWPLVRDAIDQMLASWKEGADDANRSLEPRKK